MRINNIDVNFLFGLGYRKYEIEWKVKRTYCSGSNSGITFTTPDSQYLKTPCFKTGIEVKYHPIKHMTVSFNCGYLIAGSRTLELPPTKTTNSYNSYVHSESWLENGSILKTTFQAIDFGIGIGFNL